MAVRSIEVFAIVLLLSGSDAASSDSKQPPNIVVVITDDQDLTLGSLNALPQTQELIASNGANFSNYFVTTPICCPSRTSLLTGLYAHNLEDQTLGWCGDFASRENNTFAWWLQQAGYQTGLFGKYYNGYADFCDQNVHVPRGWDRFFAMCNDNMYFNNLFNDQAKMVQYGSAPQDYMTSVIGNQTIAWLQKVAGQAPFLAYVAPHASHVPATPAPWYNTSFAGLKAPRTPSYDYNDPNRHWLIAQQPPMSPELIEKSDELFRNRWRTLQSVDDLVAAIFDTLSAVPGVLDNTYIMFTSDHGYQLGQFRLPSGKFQVYEHDIRVPFMIRGPGIEPGTAVSAMAANVDLSSTIAELARVPRPPDAPTDGRSLVALLFPQGDEHQPVPHNTSGTWRDLLLIEYWGVGYVARGPCDAGCDCEFDWVSPCPGHDALEDAPSNTYSGLRIINATMDVMYAEFRPRNLAPFPEATNATELYFLDTDPFQLTNAVFKEPPPRELLVQLHNELFQYVNCSAETCP